MADESLNLKVTLETARTQAELEKLRRDTTAFRKEQLLGSKEFLTAAKQEAEIKNKLHTINQMAFSDNAKLKESYFELGHKIRGLKVAGIEAAQALGYQAGGFGAILSTMIGPAGLIGAVGGGIALLITRFNELQTAATNAAQAGLSAFMQGARFAPGTLETQRATQSDALNALNTKYGLVGRAGVYGDAGARAVMSSEDYQKRVALQQVLSMLDAEIAKEQALNIIKGMGLQIEKQKTQEIGKQVSSAGGTGRLQAPGHYYDQYGPALDNDFRLSGNMPVEGLTPRYNLGPPTKLSGPAQAGNRLNKELERTQSLTYQIGLSINSQIGGALQNVIGQAQGFEGVLLAILGDLLSFGLSLGLNALNPFSSIGSGSVVSGGSSALRTGRSAGTIAQGRTRSGGGGNLPAQIAQALSMGSLRARGSDLVWVMESGSRAVAGARI